MTALRRLGILVEHGQADWYPCGGPHGEVCPRRVVPNLGNQTHPFVAVCGQGNGACDSVALGEAELRLLAVSYDGLAVQLRRAFDLSGVVDAEEAGFPESRRIGESAGRPAFLAPCPGTPAPKPAGHLLAPASFLHFWPSAPRLPHHRRARESSAETLLVHSRHHRHLAAMGSVQDDVCRANRLNLC